MKVGLVSCCSEKLDAPAPARELYTSPLFRGSLKISEATCDRTFVLSAEHGLVDLDAVVVPYNTTLARRPIAARVLWGHRVVIQLVAAIGADRDHKLVVFAGQLYVLPIVQAIRPLRWTLHDPMAGLQIGERLRWLVRQSNALQERS